MKQGAEHPVLSVGMNGQHPLSIARPREEDEKYKYSAVDDCEILKLENLNRR